MFYQVHLILIRIYQSGERKVTRWHFAGVYDFFANSIHTACNIITEMHTTYQCQSELQIALTCWLDASFPFVKRSPYKIQLNRMQCVASLMSIIQLNKSHLVNWRTPTCDDHNFVCATPIGSSSYIVIDSQCILSQSYRFTMSRDDHEIKLFDRPWNWCPAFIEWSELYLQSVKSPPLTSLMPLIATTKTLLNGNTTIDYAWISLIIEWYDSFAVCARVWKMGPFCSIVQHTIITMMMRSIIVIRKMTISVCRLTRVIIAIALCPHTDHNTRRCSKEIHCWYHIVYCKQLSPKHRLSMCVCVPLVDWFCVHGVWYVHACLAPLFACRRKVGFCENFSATASHRTSANSTLCSVLPQTGRQTQRYKSFRARARIQFCWRGVYIYRQFVRAEAKINYWTLFEFDHNEFRRECNVHSCSTVYVCCSVHNEQTTIKWFIELIIK